MDKRGKDFISFKDLSSSLECPVCKEFRDPPIFYQCKTGHTVCYVCRPSLEKCPFCDELIGDTRNFALEGIANLPQTGQASIPVGPPVPAGEIQIFVKTLMASTYVLTIAPTSLISELKQKIEFKEGIPAISQRLIFLGKEMENKHSLTRYKVKDGSTLHLVLRLLGGQGPPLALTLDIIKP